MSDDRLAEETRVAIDSNIRGDIERLKVETGKSLELIAHEFARIGIEAKRKSIDPIAEGKVASIPRLLPSFREPNATEAAQINVRWWDKEDATESDIRDEVVDLFEGNVSESVTKAVTLGHTIVFAGDADVEGALGVPRPFAEYQVDITDLDDDTKLLIFDYRELVGEMRENS